MSAQQAQRFPGTGLQWSLGLIALILAACLISDGLSGGPQLTVPLLLAGGLSWLVCWLGIPRLRALKMGQVIRQEGPQSHQSKSGTPTMAVCCWFPAGWWWAAW